MIPNIRIKEFNPRILETRRLAGSPPTIVVIGKRGYELRDLSNLKEMPITGSGGFARIQMKSEFGLCPSA